MEKAHIIISGYVQAVGFRQFVKKQAIKCGLIGWVRNITDGNVEALFVGSKENIEKVIAACQKGPMLSEVKDVEVLWNPEYFEKEDYTSFEILPTL